MKFAVALLCDAATVREGLLHLLGGAVTRIWRTGLPAALNVDLALVIALEESQLDLPHQVELTIANADGVVGQAMGAFQASRPPKLELDEALLVPSVLSLRHLATNVYGRHTIDVSLDGGAVETKLAFWVLDQAEMTLPPIS